MFARFVSNENKFFDLFNGSADLSVEAVSVFRAMLNDISQVNVYSKQIKDLEHRADEITHTTIALLHKTFITPLDREDIHKLITELDDILDFIDAATQRILLYGITQFTPETKLLADVCVQSITCVKKAVHGLRNLKNADQILKDCIEINRLENEADQILRAGMAKLFQEEPDTRQLIKIKELYELLETVTDRCEDVANVIEGIVLEYA